MQYTFCLCPVMRINHICSYCSSTSQFFLPKLHLISSLLVRGLVTFIKLNKLLNNWWYTIENSKVLTPFRWKRFFTGFYLIYNSLLLNYRLPTPHVWPFFFAETSKNWCATEKLEMTSGFEELSDTWRREIILEASYNVPAFA